MGYGFGAQSGYDKMGSGANWLQISQYIFIYIYSYSCTGVLRIRTFAVVNQRDARVTLYTLMFPSHDGSNYYYILSVFVSLENARTSEFFFYR